MSSQRTKSCDSRPNRTRYSRLRGMYAAVSAVVALTVPTVALGQAPAPTPPGAGAGVWARATVASVSAASVNAHILRSLERRA